MIFDLVIDELISKFQINLSGLNVYTEAASGPYMAAPILCALGGAKNVTAQVADSCYGAASEIIKSTYSLAENWNVSDKIKCIESRSLDDLMQADIVTNSGHVRPIDSELISSLKPTAVIPLMWETWELRRSEFDLDACKEKKILTLGTNESHSLCNMDFFIGLTGLKLLLENNFEGRKILLIGSDNSPANSLYEYFKKINLDVVWINDHTSFEKDSSNNNDLRKLFSQVSHIIIAEHTYPHEILGMNRIICPKNLSIVNPNVKVLVMCGNISENDARSHNITIFPNKISPFGHITYQLYNLGPLPVLNLFAAGIKVGEQMARARLMGKSCDMAARDVLDYGLACDYLGEDAWVK